MAICRLFWFHTVGEMLFVSCLVSDVTCAKQLDMHTYLVEMLHVFPRRVEDGLYQLQ